MDILKRVHANPDACEITGDTINIQGREYDGAQTVNFPTKKTKEYSLKAVVFFILNSGKSLRDYMALCKTSEVTPISHVDKSSILSEIQSFVPVTVKGFFISPRYESGRAYDVPMVTMKDIIVVSSSLVSKIHIDNIERLIVEGIFDTSTVNPLSANSKKIKIGENIFIVVNNVEDLRKDDWGRAKAVFIDNSAAPGSEAILTRIPKDAIIFSLEAERFRSVKLEISNGILKNHKKVLEVFK